MFTVLLAFVVLRERLNKMQMGGMLHGPGIDRNPFDLRTS